MSDSTNERRLAAAAESTVAKAGARIVTPVLLTVCMGLLTVFGNRLLTQQDKQGADIAQVKSDVRDLGTRFDVQVIRTVDDHSKHFERVDATIDDHSRHLEKIDDEVATLKRAARLP